MADQKVTELPVFRQRTPDELLTGLQDLYKEDIKVYRTYLSVLSIPFLLCVGGSIYWAFTKNLGIFEYAQHFLHGYITFAIMYFILRYKMKPKKPTIDDAINWREERKENYKWLNIYKRSGKL